MQIKIGDFEVKLTAKAEYKERYNVKDTQAFLNRVSLIASYAEEALNNSGLGAMAGEAARLSNDIYKALMDMGVYDE